MHVLSTLKSYILHKIHFLRHLRVNISCAFHAHPIWAAVSFVHEESAAINCTVGLHVMQVGHTNELHPQN